MTIRIVAVIMLLLACSSQAADDLQIEGMTIFGDQEKPRVQTSLPWQRVDIDTELQYPLAKMIETIFKKSSHATTKKLMTSASEASSQTREIKMDSLSVFLKKMRGQ